MPTLYTIGYGRTTKVEFLERLRIQFPDKDAIIYDVRKEGGRSRNGRWAWQGVDIERRECMSETIVYGGLGLGYVAMPELCNTYGNTISGFRRYALAVARHGDLVKYIENLAERVLNADTNHCILCAERKPFRAVERQGQVFGEPNCHRVLVAESLIARLHYYYQSSGWIVEHLV